MDATKKQKKVNAEMDTNIRIGRRVKAMLALRGLTSKQLAEMTGMSTQTISYIINGKTDARLSTISTLEKALECTLILIPNEDLV